VTIARGGHVPIVPELERPHPVEATKDAVNEAARGRSLRTPFLAFTGVTVVVAVLVAVVLTAALLVYYLV
jgi:hypothetical protein